MRIVIIGGDAAGMSAASEARRRAKEAEIIVLEKTHDVSYGACGLPYKLPLDTDVESLKVITAERFRSERRIDVRLGHEVSAIQVGKHKVKGTNEQGEFEVEYDKLLIATGASAIRPAIEGMEELWGRGAYTLKTLEDGRLMKRALAERPASVAIIGGGYIGLEAADNLREMGLDVTIVEALPDILPFLSESARERVYQLAEQRGVKLVRDAKVTKAQRRQDGKIALSTPKGEIVVDLVLVAVGVRPASELAKDAGIELSVGGSIRVDDELRTSAQDIYSAGDCADAIHGVSGERVWIPLALRANRAGKLSAQSMLGMSVAAPPVMGTAIFKFFELQIARTGLSLQEAKDAGFDAVSVDVRAGTRAHYYPGGSKLSVTLVGDKATGRVLGASMVGHESAAHRIDTVVAVLHGKMTAKQLYEMDLAYAPPFSPSWSPLLIAASKLMKAVG